MTIPYKPYSVPELAEIRRFVDSGGTLELMDDFGYGNDVLAHLGLKARFSHLLLLDPLFCYKNPALPVITDFTPPIDGVEEVLLNHATVLIDVDDDAVIARSSASSFLDANENSAFDEGEQKGPFPVAAVLRLGAGTVVLISDPSVVLNSTISRFDNFAFVSSLSAGLGARGVILDQSHLTGAPLDVSKKRITDAREFVASPYTLVGLLAVILTLSAVAIIRKGETIEHQTSR